MPDLGVTREDLIQPCPACRGTGRPDPAGAARGFQMQCPRCGGKGEFLTRTGKVLADFMRDVQSKNLQPLDPP